MLDLLPIFLNLSFEQLVESGVEVEKYTLDILLLKKHVNPSLSV